MLRLATPDDAVEIAAIYAPVVRDTAISFEVVPPSPREMAERVMKIMRLHPWIVRVEQGRVLGYAYAHPHSERQAYQWSVDTAIYIHEEARGRGVGRALYQALFAALVHQGIVNAYAGITLPNAASERLHASVGFEPIGVFRAVGHKMGSWHDVGRYQRALVPRPAEPAPPRALPEVRGEIAGLLARFEA